METPAVHLTSQQQEALEWVTTRLTAGAPLIALRGYAGSGKSFLIPHLKAALEAAGLHVSIGAPTHRAAMILRQKGITDSNTVHSLALTPYFTPDFARAMAWLGEDAPTRPESQEAPHEDVEGLPWLLHEALTPDLGRARALRRARSHSAKKRLESVGIHGRDYFAGFGAKACDGVLIIDEASMVGTAMLALCQSAFPQVLLVGDPGQLPPVKDTAQLAAVEGYTLTEVHRQAADSPIIQLATRARNGEAFWRERLTLLSDPPRSDVLEVSSAQASAFLTAPLLVWKNDTRKHCTQAIRRALGYARELLYVGEPLVCRSTSPEDRSENFLNNALFTITGIDPTHPRRITVEDALGQSSSILAHIEELDGDAIDPRAIPFRLAYALTVHTAQGGEWPTVYISLPDLRDYVGFCAKTQRQTESAQWAYTSITRAKETLFFLASHTFTATQERSAMAETPPVVPVAEAAWPASHPVLDDIEDPIVPPGVTTPPAVTPAMQAALDQAVHPSLSPPQEDQARFGAHEALLQGFCLALQGKLAQWMTEQQLSTGRVVEMIFTNCKEHVATLATANEHSQYQLAHALTQLHEQGVTLRIVQNPYTVDISAVSPQGFPMTLHIVKTDVPSFLEELGQVTTWLTANGYTMPPAATPY